jgi:hypothetical protein
LLIMKKNDSIFAIPGDNFSKGVSHLKPHKMATKPIELNKATFEFFDHKNKDLIKVVWISKGRGIVNGREYARAYAVTIVKNEIVDPAWKWTSSLQCNITNSLDFLKTYLAG